MTLTYTVSRGADRDTVLKPHYHSRGGKRGYKAIAFKSGPEVLVSSEDELIPYIRKGWLVRMSAPGHPPAGIRPESIKGWH